jgi:hypothetical protein
LFYPLFLYGKGYFGFYVCFWWVDSDVWGIIPLTAAGISPSMGLIPPTLRFIPPNFGLIPPIYSYILKVGADSAKFRIFSANSSRNSAKSGYYSAKLWINPAKYTTYSANFKNGRNLSMLFCKNYLN